MKKMNAAINITVGFGLVMGLAACGPMQQDPLEKYPLTKNSRPIDDPNDLKKVIPETRIEYVEKEVAVDRPVYYPKEVEQNYAAAQLFQISTNQNIAFVAGVEAKIPFEVRILQGEVDFDASLSGLDGASFKEVASDKNKKSYVLTFSPKVDMIAGSSREQSGVMKVNLNVKSIKAENADKQKRIEQAFEVVSKTKAFEFTVRRDYRNPKMEIANFPSSIDEGSKKAFQIKVSAPGTYSGYQPEIQVTYDNKGLTGSVFENTGAPFIRPDSSRARVEKIGDGQWVFNYEVDTNAFALPAQLDKSMNKMESAASVALRVSFQVISPAGTTSDLSTMQYKIVYKKAAPVAEQTAAVVTQSRPEEKK